MAPVEENELDARIVQQRSLHAMCDLEAGTVLTRDHFEILRPCPAQALRPFMLGAIVGRELKKAIRQGEQMTSHHLD